MNNFKYFDKTQFIITIAGVSSLLMTIVMYFVALFTSQVKLNEAGDVEDIVFNPVLINIFFIFLIINALANIWFIARSVTYKARKKEAEALE